MTNIVGNVVAPVSRRGSVVLAGLANVGRNAARRGSTWARRGSTFSLTASVKKRVIGERDEWKQTHLGTSANLKIGRSSAKHEELRNPNKPVGPRVAHPSEYFIDLARRYERRAKELEVARERFTESVKALAVTAQASRCTKTFFCDLLVHCVLNYDY